MRLWGEKSAELFRFCVAGGAGFLVDYGILYVATEFLGLRYLYSAALSFIIAVLLNYRLCLVYVFRTNSHQTIKQIVSFFSVSFVGLGLNQACMWILVEKVALWYIAAKLVATVVVMGWNYLMKRLTIRG